MALGLLYSLYVRSFDMRSGLSVIEMSGQDYLDSINPVRWPFSILDWSGGTGWM